MLRPTSLNGLIDFSSLAKVKTQDKIQFRTFCKKNQIFMFLCCSSREDLSIDVSITNVGLILTKLWRFFSRGTDRQTRIWNLSYGNMSAHKKISTQSSKLVVNRRSLYASPEVGDA